MLKGVDSTLEDYFENNPVSTRGSLYIPSNPEHNSLEDLDKMSAILRSTQSMESLHSNNKSRVTSWTNSTITNSIAARGTSLERKRLSIIKEDGGPHQSSSSAGIYPGGIEAFRRPLRTQDSRSRIAPAIDTQRVYSALMKRIDQEQAEAESANPTPKHVSENAAPTIRAVTSETSLKSIALDNEHRQFSICAPSWQEDSGTTPQQVAHHNETLEKRRSKLAVAEAQSSFFPFSSETNPQTPSPFKVALAALKENQQGSESDSGTVIITRPNNNQVHGRYGTSSESIYSRTTGGHTDPNFSSTGASQEDVHEEPAAAGMVTIVPARVHRYPKPSPSLVQLHQAKTSAKTDSKTQLESQIMSLDRRVSRASNAHYREDTQIDGEDTSVGRRGGRPSSFVRFLPGMSHRASQRTVSDIIADQSAPTGLQRRRSLTNKRFTVLDQDKTPKATNPALDRLSSSPRSLAADLKRASATNVDTKHQQLNEDRERASDALETAAKRPSVSPKIRNKENQGHSAPISSPGRSKLCDQQMQTRTKTLFAALNDVTPTPKQRIRSHVTRLDWGQFKDITNESDRNPSRLSGPPPGNFDDGVAGQKQNHCSHQLCDYDLLGEREQIPTVKNHRPRPSLVSVVNPAGYAGDDEGGDMSALPKIEARTVKVINSRRMVSNFLRSRRRTNVEESTRENETENAQQGIGVGHEDNSPAFV